MIYIVGLAHIEHPKNFAGVYSIDIVRTRNINEVDVCNEYLSKVDYISDGLYKPHILGFYSNARCFIKNEYFIYINFKSLLNKILKLRFTYEFCDEDNINKDDYVIIDMNGIIKKENK